MSAVLTGCTFILESSGRVGVRQTTGLEVYQEVETEKMTAHTDFPAIEELIRREP